jgi:hypothetical protein
MDKYVLMFYSGESCVVLQGDVKADGLDDIQKQDISREETRAVIMDAVDAAHYSTVSCVVCHDPGESGTSLDGDPTALVEASEGLLNATKQALRISLDELKKENDMLKEALGHGNKN